MEHSGKPTPTIKLRIVFSRKPPEASRPTCSLCSRSFFSVKALHGHMRSHRNYSAPPPPPTPPRPTDLIHPRRQHPPPPLSWSRAAKKQRTPRVPVGPHPEVFDAEKEEQPPSEESCTNVGGAVASWQEEYPGAVDEQRRRTSEPSEAPPSCSTRSCEPPPPAASSFACSSPSCGKTFPSYQALCGHMATHRKRQHEPLSSRKCYCCYYASPPAESKIKRGVKRAKSAAAEHRCNVCGKVFPTGQALGGHKRLHREGSKAFTTLLLLPPAAGVAAATGDSTWGSKDTITPVESWRIHAFDLNEMPVMEEEDGDVAADLRELLLLV